MDGHPWTLAFGILGNIFSIMLFLSPLPTFLRVYRKKSTEGFQSIPYVFGFLCAMLWVYYATLKSHIDYLVLTLNSVGCFLQSIYIVVFIVYAPKETKMLTLKLVLLLNFGGFFSILVLTQFFANGSSRLHIVGWCCAGLSTAVFVSPLSIMGLVIRTKSVKYMPFGLSFFLTLSAIMWSLYGLLLKDLYIEVPNFMGVALGAIQMIIYAIYKNHKKVTEEQNLEEQIDGSVKLNPVEAFEVDLVSSPPICNDKVDKKELLDEQVKTIEDCIAGTNQVQLSECFV